MNHSQTAPALLTGTDLLSLREVTGPQIEALVRQALAIKQNPEEFRHALSGKGLLLLMQKTSTRTVLAFTAGMFQMGGYALRMDWDTSNFAISPLALEAKYVSTSIDAVMARLLRYEDVAALAEHATIPVVNGCCNTYHPSQTLADLLTVLEVFGRFDGVRLTYVGVHNNVTNSLLAGATKVGVQVNLVTPVEHKVDPELVAEAEATGLVKRYASVQDAAADSDIVYTDTWIDMENFDNPAYQPEKERRIAQLTPFQLNATTLAGSDPYVMHDMPVHPGFEISAELVASPKSVIFQQAENRLHSAKSILHALLAG